MKKKKIAIFLVVLQIISVILIYVNKSFAENADNLLTNSDLYNETNTYNYNYQSCNFAKDKARYDLAKKNDNVVDDGAPLMTVFTHGVTGYAFHWSNDGINNKFSYSKYSLITRMANMIDSNIYYVVFDDKTKDCVIYDITKDLYQNLREGNHSQNQYSTDNKINNIVDISKHSIVVFESSDVSRDGINDAVYTEFNYTISKLVLDIKKINNGKLPKINLIGHSRGGITNMQYALDHPDLVASMYALGTPFAGSTTASIDYDFFNGHFTGNKDVAGDITKEEVYMEYMNRWNNNYDRLYKNINVMALGTYEGYLSFYKILTSDSFYDQIDLKDENVRKVCKLMIPSCLNNLAPIIYIQKQLDFSLFKIIMRELVDILSYCNIQESAIDDILIILFKELYVTNEYPRICWASDVLVNLSSQLGYKNTDMNGTSYRGFNRKTKCLLPSNSNYDAIAVPKMPAVGHNLETMDHDLGSYILNDIKVGMNINKDYLYFIDDNSNAIIDTYLSTDVKVNIPEYLNGHKLVGISDGAFYNGLIEDISIPDSTTFIGASAFANCINLKQVSLSASSNLESIGANAFHKCESLESISLPKKLTNIGNNAFIESNITNIDFGQGNSNYRFVNGMLINKKTKSVIFASKNLVDVIVPDNIESIDANAFINHQNIKTINLNNVTKIGTNAFLCSTLENVTGGAVSYVGSYAFGGTKYLEGDDNEFKQLGSVLIKCNITSDTVVVPSTILSVSCGFDTNVKRVIFPSKLESIENFDMSGLESIIITGNSIPTLGGDIFNKDIKIYVNENSYPLYKKDDLFTNSFWIYKDNVFVKDININFFDENGNIFDTKVEQYGSLFDNYAEAPKKAGYVFKYYIDDEENIYEFNKTINSYLDLNLHPVYEKAVYSITVDGEDVNYTLDDFSKTDKPGYDFLGWYTKKSGGTRIDDIEKYMSEHENPVFYKRYQIINYDMVIDINGQKQNLNYNVEKPIRLANLNELDIIRFGYAFDSWYLENGDEFETTENKYEKLYVKAKWIGEEKTYLPSIYIDKPVFIFDLKNYNPSVSHVFYVLESVKSVTFIGNNKDFISFQIIIKERCNRLVLGLDNITIRNAFVSSKKGTNTIDYEGISYFDFNLIVNGECKISGGTGSHGVTCDGFDGGIGINVPSFYACAFDNENSKLIVNGGNGGVGGNGYRGDDGLDGVKGPSGSIFNPIKGDDGQPGTDGKDGYRGGNGNYAIYVSKLSAFAVDKNLKFEFIGGNGGKGGLGGAGGNGGTGASDMSADMFTGVGKPGNGGNAGNGGNGGDGGNGSAATNYEYVLSSGGDGGQGGAGGLAGTPGNGGDAGSVGSDGSSGSSGSDGDNGGNGEKGKSGVEGKKGNTGIKGLNRNNNAKVFRSSAKIFTRNYIFENIKEYEIKPSCFNVFVNRNNQSQYLNEEESKSVVVNNNLTIDTKRLRCSYIENQYLVLSAKKANAGTAYLEMNFDSYLNYIDFEIGLWSTKEGINANNSKILFQYQNGNGDWITIDDMMKADISTKENMNSYQYNLNGYYTKSIRFIVTVDNPTGSANKGRVVIGNLKVQK